MGLDHQPYRLTGSELQRVAGGEGKVDFHFHSTIHPGNDDYVSLNEFEEPAGDYIAGAQANRRGYGKKNVAGADAYSQRGSGLGAD